MASYFDFDSIGDDQNKVKRPLYQGFANTPVLCISVSVLRDLHWLPLVISRFPSITIVYFTFPIMKQLKNIKNDHRLITIEEEM